MECPQVVDGRDDLHIWRVTANILDKHLLTADTVWSSNFGVGLGANNSLPQKPTCYEMLHRASDLNVFFGMIWATENGFEIWNMEC
jgi:hypothetical protein